MYSRFQSVIQTTRNVQKTFPSLISRRCGIGINGDNVTNYDSINGHNATNYCSLEHHDGFYNSYQITHCSQKMTHSTYKHMTQSSKMHYKGHTSMMSKMMSYMKTAEKDKLNGSSFIAFQLMPLVLAFLCSIKMQFY